MPTGPVGGHHFSVLSAETKHALAPLGESPALLGTQILS
jgi:hypothetical protein